MQSTRLFQAMQVRTCEQNIPVIIFFLLPRLTKRRGFSKSFITFCFVPPICLFLDNTRFVSQEANFPEAHWTVNIGPGLLLRPSHGPHADAHRVHADIEELTGLWTRTYYERGTE